jgi:hypothetical protein
MPSSGTNLVKKGIEKSHHEQILAADMTPLTTRFGAEDISRGPKM